MKEGDGSCVNFKKHTVGRREISPCAGAQLEIKVPVPLKANLKIVSV